VRQPGVFELGSDLLGVFVGSHLVETFNFRLV
jgi:hypothetical protein